MANAAKKHPKNVPGPWYVDLTCIACDTCTDISPEVFGRDGDRKAFVREQRTEDAALFLFAMESCPVEAVGSEE
ncbi:hypothetical protein LBMAG42_05190 [Deltaproteobacteria bacterium]|nr:hypothetical protein LBMAG42_05190 [Deltaproteobacteria bacterium]